LKEHSFVNSYHKKMVQADVENDRKNPPENGNNRLMRKARKKRNSTNKYKQ
jgi:hypothetical protein